MLVVVRLVAVEFVPLVKLDCVAPYVAEVVLGVDVGYLSADLEVVLISSVQ